MSWLFTFIALGLIWLWWDGLGARETARRTGMGMCTKHDLQFLDDTVMQAKLALRRDAGGNLRIYRRFAFEFSTDGDSRYQGYVDMLGQHVIATYMDPYRV